MEPARFFSSSVKRGGYHQLVRSRGYYGGNSVGRKQLRTEKQKQINDNQEIMAFSLGNFAAAFTGCCPINGSVSRTAMGEQYQAKTQLTGLVAGGSMIILLLCCTGFIGYLPIPVLTAIVISALLGATEFELVPRLWKVSRTECFIFLGAFFGVLFWEPSTVY